MKISSVKWPPFCAGGDLLKWIMSTTAIFFCSINVMCINISFPLLPYQQDFHYQIQWTQLQVTTYMTCRDYMAYVATVASYSLVCGLDTSVCVQFHIFASHCFLLCGHDGRWCTWLSGDYISIYLIKRTVMLWWVILVIYHHTRSMTHNRDEALKEYGSRLWEMEVQSTKVNVNIIWEVKIKIA